MSDQHDRRRRFTIFPNRGIGELVARRKVIDVGVHAGFTKPFGQVIYPTRKNKAQDTADQVSPGERMWRDFTAGR